MKWTYLNGIFSASETVILKENKGIKHYIYQPRYDCKIVLHKNPELSSHSDII
jgi:hypothetical protein